MCHVPPAGTEKGEIAFGTMDNWPAHWRFLRAVRASPVTMLQNAGVRHSQWSMGLTNAAHLSFRIPRAIFRRIEPSSGVSAVRIHRFSAHGRLRRCWESSAAFVKSHCFAPGCVKNTGTVVLLMNVGGEPRPVKTDLLITTSAWA